MIIAVTAFILASCSVKEDRMLCPCWLSVDLSSFEAAPEEVGVYAWRDSLTLFADTVAVADYPEGYMRSIPKGYASVAVISGFKECQLRGSDFITPYGKMFDALQAGTDFKPCFDEEMKAYPVSTKQYANVRLYVEGAGETYPFYFCIKSNVAGISLLNLAPIKGEFSCEIHLNGKESALLRVPRQFHINPYLILNVYRESDQVCVYTENLAETIAQKGFNWQEANLGDIDLYISVAEAEFNVKVDAWNDGIHLKPII